MTTRSACCVSQLAALPPNIFDSRTAISGEIPRLPFTSSDSFVRVTPSAAAVSVVLNPPTARCTAGGLRLRDGEDSSSACAVSLSVIVNVVHLQRVAFVEAKDNPPVGANGYRTEAF